MNFKNKLLQHILLTIALLGLIYVSFKTRLQVSPYEIEYEESLKLIHRLQSIHFDEYGYFGKNFSTIGYLPNPDIHHHGHSHFHYQMESDSFNFTAKAIFLDQNAKFKGRKWKIDKKGNISEILD